MRFTTLVHAPPPPPPTDPRRAGRIIHLSVDYTTWRRGRTRRALGRPSCCSSSNVDPGLCLPTRSGGSDAPSKYSSALHTTVPPFVVAHLFAFTAPPSLTFTAKIHLASSSGSLTRSLAHTPAARLPVAFGLPCARPSSVFSVLLRITERGKVARVDAREGGDRRGGKAVRANPSPLRHVLY